MNAWSAILAEAQEDGTLFVLGGFFLTLILLRAVHADERRRVRAMSLLTAVHVLLLPVTGALRAGGSLPYLNVRLAAMIFAALAGVSTAGALLFAVLLPLVRLRTPRILQDVVVAGTAIAAVFLVASRNGFNLSNLLTTSAIITAIVGFSLQDTLGNIAGGLALQLDNSVSVGDWIKVGEVSGKVTEIRWRYTAVETRNWETLIIPNSVLMKGQVTILGRRDGEPVQLRRWVWFNVDYRYAPSEVIQHVTECLHSAEIPNVADKPTANCVLMEFGESSGHYAVRYWLTDLALDDPTDSRVRTCVYFALKRAGIPVSIPAQSLFVTEESADRKIHKHQEDFAARERAISGMDLFARVSDAERVKLAQGLRPAPFATGEVMTRQGAQAHWLYMIFHGTASVRVTNESGLTREVAQLHDGDFFGEMSLMTGAPRAATVVALTEVDCYRLDKATFQELLRARPELAVHVAETLARRQVGLSATIEDLDSEAKAQRLAARKLDLLAKIRAFFGLGGEERAAG